MSGRVRGGEASASSGSDRRRFVRALSRHRRRGCCALVYGDLPTARKDAVSRKHLGASDRRRYRVFGLADAPRSVVPERLPTGVAPDDETVAVVDRSGPLRSCAAADPSPSAPVSDDLPVPPSAGAAALGDAMARLARANDGFEPSELRVCVDSLAPFVAGAPLDDVRAAVRRLAAEVRAYRGMCHAFLPLSADHEAVAALRPLFKVEIELRRNGAVMRVEDGGERRAQAMPLSLVTQYDP